MKPETDKRGGLSAYLTVYLALTMAVLLSLCLALIEGARSNGIRLEAECVMDIGLNSVMAEYHKELFEQYNLFAIDSAYGSGYPGKENTALHLQDYIEKNLSVENIFLEDIFYRDFLAMSVEDIEIIQVEMLTDGNGAIFRRRAAETIRSDVGLDLLEELSGWMQTVEEYRLNEWDVMAEKEELDAQLAAYSGMEMQVSENEWQMDTFENPTGLLENIRIQGILSGIIPATVELSSKTIQESNLLTTRMEAGIINTGNWEAEVVANWDEITERFLFQEYLLKYLGRYGAEKENAALDYQMEYLIAGSNSDLDNLRNTATLLCFVRAAANATYLLADEEKCAIAGALADLIAALCTQPEIAPILKACLLLAWVYAESLFDTGVLLAGGKIPLLKDDDSWVMSLERALQADVMSNEDFLEGLGYEDYLRIFMMLMDKDTLTGRAMDMVEADIRLTPGNAEFRLDGCYDGIKGWALIKSDYGYMYEITRKKKYSLY